MIRRCALLCLTLLFAAATAVAKPPLRDVAEIDETLLAVGLANDIRENCPDISARVLKALVLLRNLKARANELGYSDDEIDAYRSSDVEKARMRTEGDAWLAAHGVTEGDAQSFCAAGRAEIEKDSQIGALLKVN